MPLPGSGALNGMDYAFQAEPFVQVPAKADAVPLDLAFNAQPFLSANLPINMYGDASGCASVALSTDAYAVYQWQTSADNAIWADISLATNPTYTVVSTAYYRVSAKVSISDPWLYSTGQLVTIYATPVMGIVGGSADCTSVTLTATGSDIVTYQWAKGGSPVGTNSDTYVATESGSYTVAGTNSHSCYGISSAHAVTIYGFPTISITGDASGCDEVLLSTTSSDVAAYQWKIDGDIIPGAESSTYTATTSGSYTVVGTSIHSCATESAAQVVAVYASPTISITGDATGCGSVLLSTTSSGVASYQWKLGGSIILGAESDTYTATESGSYTVVGTSSHSCVTESAPHATTVYVPPTISISGATSGCDSVSLSTVESGVVSYQWKLDGDIIVGAESDTYVATASGSYTVVGTSADACVAESSSHVVTVYITPAAPTITVTFATLSVPNIYAAYQWRLEGDDILGATSATHAASVPGNYSILVTDANGCSVLSAEIFLNLDAYVSVTANPVGPAKLEALWPGKTVARVYWFLNNVMLFNTTEEFFVPTATGYYKAAIQTVDNFTAMTPNVYVAGSYVEWAPALALNGSVASGAILSRYTDIIFDVTEPTGRFLPLSYINFFVYQNGGLLESITKDSPYVSYTELSNGWRFTINGPSVSPKYRFKNGSIIEVKVTVTN